MLHPDPDAYDFQTLITSSLFRDTSLVFHEDPFSSLYTKLLTSKHKDKEMPIKRSLIGGGNGSTIHRNTDSI